MATCLFDILYFGIDARALGVFYHGVGHHSRWRIKASVTAIYRLRYFFEWGGPVLWSDNDAARDAFGYPADLALLPLSPATVKRAKDLVTWHDTALNEEYPPEPDPWTADECDRFNVAARDLLVTIRAELGNDFDVIDEFTPESA